MCTWNVQTTGVRQHKQRTQNVNIASRNETLTLIPKQRTNSSFWAIPEQMQTTIHNPCVSVSLVGRINENYMHLLKLCICFNRCYKKNLYSQIEPYHKVSLRQSCSNQWHQQDPNWFCVQLFKMFCIHFLSIQLIAARTTIQLLEDQSATMDSLQKRHRDRKLNLGEVENIAGHLILYCYSHWGICTG